MNPLSDLSYRYKVPLMVSITILITTIVISLVLGWRAYDDLRKDLFQNAIEVGGVLSNSLPEAIRHDDLWLAYQILNAARVNGEGVDERLLIVLDDDLRIYVSSEPRRFPVLSRLGGQGEELARLAEEIQDHTLLTAFEYDSDRNERI